MGREHAASVPERPLLGPWVQAAAEPGRALFRSGDGAVLLEGAPDAARPIAYTP